MTDVMSRVHDHLDESLQRFDESRIVGIFLQGSQNYGLETPKSDVDTKLIVLLLLMKWFSTRSLSALLM